MNTLGSFAKHESSKIFAVVAVFLSMTCHADEVISREIAVSAVCQRDVRYFAKTPSAIITPASDKYAAAKETDMRCWIMGSKRWGNTKDISWFVEWWGAPKKNEFGENDIDSAPCYSREFKTHAGALAFAKTAATDSKNYWNLSHIRKMCLEEIDGNVYDWETTGEVEEVCA